MKFFQRKFAVTSVAKIYSKEWELCMYPGYDRFYIALTSIYGKFHQQTNILPGNNNRSWVKISEHFGLRSLYDKLTNRKKLTLPLGKNFKTLKDMIIGTAGT